LGYVTLYEHNAQNYSWHAKGLTGTYHSQSTWSTLFGLSWHRWRLQWTLQPLHRRPEQYISWPLHFGSPAWAT
jgi:hypothetical protein